MAQVELFKKSGTYEENGEEKRYTNFYVRCGDSLIPVKVAFFEDKDGRDPQYNARRAVMSAFAEQLPEKAKDNAHAQPAANSKLKATNAKDPF